MNWLVQWAGRMPSSGDRRVRFGLGTAGRADSLHIYWPSGALQRLADLPIDTYVRIEEGARGGCCAARGGYICGRTSP